MKPIDVILIAIIVLVIGGAIAYIIKAKKNGQKCIGCPDAKTCGGNCVSCQGCYRQEKEKEI